MSLKPKTLIQKFIKLLNKIRFRFPSYLPCDNIEFEAFCESIYRTYNIVEDPNTRHTIANAILHLGLTSDMKPKAFFVRTLFKSMANSVAFEVMQKVRQEEKIRQEEILKKDPLEKPLQNN